MPFQPIAAEKLSQAIIRQIEALILQGILRPGERLPAERELAERLDVSRPSLRDAISQMQRDGLLTARAGAGIYVADVLGGAFSPALVALFARHEQAIFDYLSFRRDMEGLAAARAAKQASDTDLAVIQAVFDKMEALHAKRNAQEESELDVQFHMAIIEASHNVVMLHMMRSMYDLLRGGVFYNRQVIFKQRSNRQVFLDQHRKINDALQQRNAAAAQAAVETHLEYVERCLADQLKADKNESVAQLRLRHETQT